MVEVPYSLERGLVVVIGVLGISEPADTPGDPNPAVRVFGVRGRVKDSELAHVREILLVKYTAVILCFWVIGGVAAHRWELRWMWRWIQPCCLCMSCRTCEWELGWELGWGMCE